jgi:hypothetical protein
MIVVGPGAKQIEFVTLEFQANILAADLRAICERFSIQVFVNDRIVGEANIGMLPSEPPFGFRFVYRIHCPVKDGDKVYAEMIDPSPYPPYELKGPVDIHAELAIVGSLDGFHGVCGLMRPSASAR